MMQYPVTCDALTVSQLKSGTRSQFSVPCRKQEFDEVERYEVYKDGSYRAVVCRHDNYGSIRSPYGGQGDRLWIREAWRTSQCADGIESSLLETPGYGYGWPVWYEADGGTVTWRGTDKGGPGFMTRGRYRHALHMPRWAARLTGVVTSVRLMRLQVIDIYDVHREGNGHGYTVRARNMFVNVWNRRYGKIRGQAFGDNPWVWVCVVDFGSVQKEKSEPQSTSDLLKLVEDQKQELELLRTAVGYHYDCNSPAYKAMAEWKAKYGTPVPKGKQ